MHSEVVGIVLGTSSPIVDTLRIIVSGGNDAERVTIVKPFWSGFQAAFLFTFLLWLLMKGRMTLWCRWSVERCKQVSSLAVVGEPVKMTLVVRKDLKMGNGKVAAQCAHAAVAVVEEILSMKASQLTAPTTSTLDSTSQLWLRWYDAWHASGCSKVALQCPDEETMMAIAKHAKAVGLPYSVVRDAGRTQIAPGSKTVVAVGPGPKSLVDEVTGQLKLL
ncbi:hypothetical protein ABL78_4821 [Leptomonas seymouri]|uniref:peptidyl-tRNA hydrolase n=1 Tax=Leptomonas seymouri TaxID=5684 RepID=A0A0N0P574_LEPSE|nr:hypothetical protein ABL78_4821 [Leptomonas seymouri]|eukprot:KPI86129.1 hypothetical protein ABL78_4821 [Leptomonas seymouri]